MRTGLRFALWTGAAFGALVALAAAVAGLVAADLGESDQRVLRRILDLKAPLLAFVGLILLLACAGLLRWLAGRYVRPLRVLAEQTRVLTAVDGGQRVGAGAGPEMAELALAINALGDAYRIRSSDTEARIAESNARLEEERNRLAALMSELSEGVLLCDARGRILLYNEQARSLFAPPGEASAAGHSPVGLGRSLFAFLDRDQVAHAMDKIQEGLERGAPAPQTTFLAAAPAGRLVRARLTPYLSSERHVAGMVLTLEDATQAFGDETKRRALLEALATGVRQPAANVRAAAENLVSFPAMSDRERARFTDIIASESLKLSVTIDTALREYADALKAGLALEEMLLLDLLRLARRHMVALPGLACRPPSADETVWVKVDSFAFVRVFASLAERLRDECGVREIGFAAAVNGAFAAVDLEWEGSGIEADALARWEGQPIRVGTEQTPLTIRDVLERHGGELWQEGGGRAGRFRFLIPLAQPVLPRPRRLVSAESRPEYYDFDLFQSTAATAELGGQRLSALSYTVFDTETTGVEPSAGDRIISIGAVRIVNGRLLRHEVFDQLVDPERPVSRESARIHGLKASDLAGQPVLREVLPAFHRFCEDTVLVAHNAAFDMRFLELAERESGVRFTQPVLDTLLLSAVLHPGHEDHRLEAIAERLGVRVIGRHTALGDALVTSEVFLRLLALLAQRGIVTLAEALEASRQTYYVRLQY